MTDQEPRKQGAPGGNGGRAGRSVLLTGATGFLGSHLCRALLAAGHRVSALSRTPGGGARLGEVASQIHWYSLHGTLEIPFREQRPEVVIHCAAVYGRTGESGAEMMEVNALLPVRLAELAARQDGRWFLNADTVLPPEVSVYALTKDQGRGMLRHLQLAMGVVDLRLQHFYGEGDDPAKFITRLIRQCAGNVPEIPLTEGRQRRDFIHIADTVRAILTLVEDLTNRSATGPSYEEVDIGSGRACEVRSVVEQIHRLTGSRSRLLFGAVPLRPAEPLVTCADTARLRGLGWEPRVSLDEGLARTVHSEKAAMKVL